VLVLSYDADGQIQVEESVACRLSARFAGTAESTSTQELKYDHPTINL
jgi:hypothetical protein